MHSHFQPLYNESTKTTASSAGAIFRYSALIFTLLFSTLGIANENYNAELAKEVGADDYGMKPYVLVTLLTGPTTDLSKDATQEAFQGHFANMTKLAEEKKLVVAGPFMDAAPKRGIFILNTNDISEAEKWVNTDPAVIAGLLTYEMDKIYSSAALMLVNDQHQTLQKKAIN